MEEVKLFGLTQTTLYGKNYCILVKQGPYVYIGHYGDTKSDFLHGLEIRVYPKEL